MNITANGTYPVDPGVVSDTSVIYVSGNLSTATVTLGYKNAAGSFISLEDGSVLTNKQYLVEHGVGRTLYVQVAGADGSTDFWVEANGMRN